MPETVRPGQVWADNDHRVEGRTLRVDKIDGDHAICTVVTGPNPAASTDRSVGKQRRILLRRFTPTSTGYRLVYESDERGNPVDR